MKKLLLTILLTALPACAYQDYMIVSESPVKSVVVLNNEIVEVKPISTIDNEKKIIMLTSLSKGKTKVEVNLYGKIKILDVKVGESSTVIKPQDGFEYFVMDNPPQSIEILTPPVKINIPALPKFGGKN